MTQSLNNLMIIAVGSTNPTKINAVKRVVERLLGEAKVVSVKSPSGVHEMPSSSDECITGAKNRANHALESGADYGVGIEGGFDETNHGMFLNAWAAVTNGDQTGIGCTCRILLPEHVAEELRKGRELGPVMDELTGQKDVKKHQGTSGVLTMGHVNRSESYEQALISAFMKFINKEYYK